jgi:uncharacterized protein YndB with AHSA1/START domain
MDAAANPGRMLQKRLGIRAPAAAVFQALTDAAELERWFPTSAETDPRPEGAYRFRFETADAPQQGHVREGVFVDVHPPKRVAYTWRAPLPGSPEGGEAPETRVQFTLAEKAGVTELVLTHSGFGYGPAWDRSFESHAEGWGFYVVNLRDHLERGVDRRAQALGLRTKTAPAVEE